MTKRGKDFLKALLAGIIAASIIDIKIVLALCLALAMAALISELTLLRAAAGKLQIIPSMSHVTCFKGEQCSADIKIHYSNRRFVSVTVSKIIAPKGVSVELDETSQDLLSLRMEPQYAGRFRGITAKFELRDPLQLFSKTIELQSEEFTVDCYPLSLLKEIKPARPIAIALGEREGTSHGIGMEFYSLDEYSASIDRKNIFWKKVASMPDERLLVKIRATNIPKSLSVSLIQTSDRGEGSLPWIDSACEGIGFLGKIILQIGCDVEIIYDRGERVVSSIATNATELSEAVMEMSTGETSNLERAAELVAKGGICITGFIEVQNELFASELARKPTLLIPDSGAELENIGDLALIYTADEDLSPLVNRVVGI